MTTSPVPPAAVDDDRALVLLARTGDRDAFGELVCRHQRRVWLVCRQYVGTDEAEAAAQDSLVKAFTSLGTFDGRAAFTTWLTRIAINTCLDILRRRKREGGRLADDDDEAAVGRVADQAADPEARALERQAVARLAAVETRLPERQRKLVRLRFDAEMELDEIAAALEVHVGTLKTQMHRAVHLLR
ncbi:MAG TPA: sigma-70 family RNA polymerase sigma factor, partial [Candidatus Sulfomarinibacteraceae bacterium]|nr:sigma-70 family RNA polymerase sigma factor [Candidatus Sulfomarinibacteraceae bacterium]